MAKQATLLGKKGDTWTSLAVGSGSEMRAEFKNGKFPGFDRVIYLDTSGVSRRKKGTPAKPKAKPKAKAKE